MGEWWWDKYYNSKEYFLVYGALIQAAQLRGTVTYQKVAELIGVPARGSFMARETGGVLGAISQNEMNNGRPMLSAVAVGVSGRPGDGFFNWARDLGRLHGDCREAEDQFWGEEKQAVYREWKLRIG